MSLPVPYLFPPQAVKHLARRAQIPLTINNSQLTIQIPLPLISLPHTGGGMKNFTGTGLVLGLLFLWHLKF
jgi:hypothetical protein